MSAHHQTMKQRKEDLFCIILFIDFFLQNFASILSTSLKKNHSDSYIWNINGSIGIEINCQINILNFAICEHKIFLNLYNVLMYLYSFNVKLGPVYMLTKLISREQLREESSAIPLKALLLLLDQIVIFF